MSDLPPPESSSAPRNAQLLHAFLIGRDVPCPRCGYNLRDATGDVCTECGTVVRLGIHPTEPVLRAWIAAIVAGSLGAGIGLLFIALILGKAGLPPERWWWLIGLSWACIPAMAWLAMARRRFLRLDDRAQWTIASGLVAADVVMFLGLMTIR